MLINLNMPANESQREFINSLNAAIRGLATSSSRSIAGFDYFGDFVGKVYGPCTLAAGVVTLSWKLHKSSDGILQSLEIEDVDGMGNIPWEQEVYQLVIKLLTSELNPCRSTYFQRSLLFYVGPQLDGEYWLPGFRFAPLWPEDPEPYLFNAERVVVLDHDVPALDEIHARSVADQSMRRISARLSLLLNIGLYTNHQTQCWVLEEADGSIKSERRLRGYIDSAEKITAKPRKAQLCRPGSYDGDIRSNCMVAGKLLSLPRESRKILRGIDHASPEITKAFDNSARLYQVGKVCGKDFPSVGLAYQVAAVEAMCQADGVHESFSDFVRAYVEPRSDLDGILDQLYGSIRSGHFHGGAFPAGEFLRQGLFDAFMSDEEIRRISLGRACEEITREAMVNWMFNRVPELSATE